MRVLILVLAIVLLPLRGWMGAAMAMAPAPAEVPPAVTATAAAASTHAAGPSLAHCHEAAPIDGAAPSVADHDGTQDGQPAGHAPCTQCQLCHSVAMNDATPRQPAVAPAQARPQPDTARFASVQPPPLDKPPIA